MIPRDAREPRECYGARFAPNQNCHRARGDPRALVRGLSLRDSARFESEIFPKRARSFAKRLIALAPLPSGILISGNFGNSGNRPRHAGARATLRVEHT